MPLPPASYVVLALECSSSAASTVGNEKMLKEGKAKVRVAFVSSYLLGQLWRSQAPHSHHVLPQSRLIPGRSELLGVGWLWTTERDGGGKNTRRNWNSPSNAHVYGSPAGGPRSTTLVTGTDASG